MLEAQCTSLRLAVLLVARDDDQIQLIRNTLSASFRVTYAPNAWEAQWQAVGGSFQALVVDESLTDTDGETLVQRLKAMGVRAPVLLLTPGFARASGGADEYLAKTEASSGVLLIRAIVAMVQRHELTEQLAIVHEQITRTRETLNKLIHDLATPLGVVVGMTQVLLSENNGLNEDGRECLEDVAREALRASEILKRVSEFDRQASVLSSPAARVRDVTVAQRREPPNMIVLIADDDSASRQLVQATLASEEYRVIEAANGEDAWRLIRQRRPAVAILDWEMPVYSGLELADVIKGDPQLRDTTVILLTGRSTAADREAGAQARADVYLTKPFSPQELVEAVENALSLK